MNGDRKMKKIILASTSPRRKELLEKLGLQFETKESNYEENLTINLPPDKLAEFLAQEKAKAVASKENELVIAADQVVACNGKALRKPHTPGGAIKMLQEISGQTVSVFTSFTIIEGERSLSEIVETKVFIKNLTDEEISNYVKSGEPIDKVGAFAIQGLGAVLVEKIEGDYFNVMGLPLFASSQSLKKFGVDVL
jgi:septum formation protein